MNRPIVFLRNTFIIFFFIVFINPWPYLPAVTWISESLGVFFLCAWALIYALKRWKQELHIDSLSLILLGISSIGLVYGIMKPDDYQYWNLSWSLFFFLAFLFQAVIVADSRVEDLKEKLLKALFVIGCVQLAFCFIHMAGILEAYTNWSQMQSFWVPHPPKSEIIVGTMFQKNHLSSLLVVFVITSIFLYLQGKIRRDLFFGILIISSYFLTQAGARGAFFYIFSLLGFSILRFLYFKKGKDFLKVLSVFVLIFMSTQGILYVTSPNVENYALNRMQKGAEIDNRGILWSQSLEVIKKNPWWGHGIGSFAHQRGQIELYKTAKEMNPQSEMYHHSHLLFLELAIDHGILIAGILSLILLGLMTKAFLNSVKQDGDWCLWLCCWIVFAHSITEYPLWYLSFFMLMYFCITLILPQGGWRLRVFPSARWILPPLILTLAVATVVTLYQYIGVVESYYQKRPKSISQNQSIPGQENPMLNIFTDFYLLRMSTDLNSQDLEKKISLCEKIVKARPVEIVYFKCAVLYALADNIPAALDQLQSAFHLYYGAAPKMYFWMKSIPIEKNPRIEILQFRIKQMMLSQ